MNHPIPKPIQPTIRTILGLSLLAILAPLAGAQAPGSGDAYVGMPHSVTLEAGDDNIVDVIIAAAAVCQVGYDAPPPLRVLLSGGIGPDDGQGPAWTFMETAWTLDWTASPDGNYSIEQTLKIPIEADGYGSGGRSGEFSVSTGSIRDDAACSPDGVTIPLRQGHAHVSVGARPAAASEGAPGLAAGLILAAIVAVAMIRRR